MSTRKERNHRRSKTTARGTRRTDSSKSGSPASAKKTAAKKTAAKKTAAKKTAPNATRAATMTRRARNKGPATILSDPLEPVNARPTRSSRELAEARLHEIDEVCNAWADIVAERMAADQTFADLVEAYQVHSARDLRGLFLWDALHAAESHVALITQVLAVHLQGRRADPIEILKDLRERQRRIAAVYSVNAFLAVINQMIKKPKWAQMSDVDPRFAVLALAHQTLSYALEAAQVAAPPDLTEHIISATQDEAVWVWQRMPEPGTETLAAAAATASFFRQLGADVLTTTDEVAALYAEHRDARAAERRAS